MPLAACWKTCVISPVAWKRFAPAAMRCALLRNEQARRFFGFFFSFPCLFWRARAERCCRFQRRSMGTSGWPLQGSHREGILLPVTMNRKPHPHILNPPRPLMSQGSHSRRGSAEHSYLGCLATFAAPRQSRSSDRTRTKEPQTAKATNRNLRGSSSRGLMSL